MFVYNAATLADESLNLGLEYIELIALVLVLHRGAKSFLSLFGKTRYMIEEILEAIKTMVPFGGVVLSLLLAISVCYY